MDLSKRKIYEEEVQKVLDELDEEDDVDEDVQDYVEYEDDEEDDEEPDPESMTIFNKFMTATDNEIHDKTLIEGIWKKSSKQSRKWCMEHEGNSQWKRSKFMGNHPEPDERILAVTEKNFFGKNYCYLWKSETENLREKISEKNIIHTKQGPKGQACFASEPLECFNIFFSRNIIELVVCHTNAQIDRRRQAYKWRENPTIKDTCQNEIKALLGILILSAALKNNHLSCGILFNKYYCGENFISAFSKCRFKFLISCLRFSSKETRLKQRNVNLFTPILELWESFIQNCRESYEPGPYITIDQQLVGFRGKCPFRVFISSKPDKYGIKVIMMCDATTYYMIDAMPYTGKNCVPQGTPAAEYFVNELVETIVGSNRNVTFDNWFTSIALAKTLLDKNLTVLGAIKENKEELPEEFVKINFMERRSGTSFFLFDQNMTAVSYKSKKDKLITLISTKHHKAKIQKQSGKPEILINYNMTKRGVDELDRLCHNMDCKRKTNRWPLVMFYNMINIACINAYIIYSHNSHQNKKEPLSRMDFMLLLHKQLVTDHLNARAAQTGCHKSTKLMIHDILGEQTTTSEKNRESKGRRKYCSLCHYSKKRTTTSYCKNCSKPICLEHTEKICPSCCETLVP